MAEAKTASKATYDTLAKALVAFQTDLPQIVKDSKAEVGRYGYEYASLPVITPVIFEKLTAVGLAYVAQPTMEDGVFVLRAELIHGESGERIGGGYPLGNPNAPAQAIGSAITYARRYALLSLTGIAPEGTDDDGAGATQNTAAQAAAAPAAPKEGSISALRKEMGDLINSSVGNVTGEDANSIMAEITGGKEPKDWTPAHLKAGKVKIAELIEERK